MREQFEKLPEISEKLKQHGIWYNEQINQYTVVMFKHNQERMEAIMFIGGAWYAFQEQQKKIDEIKELMNEYYTGSFSTIEELAGEISAALTGTED